MAGLQIVVITLCCLAKALLGDIFGLGTGHDLLMVAAVEQPARAHGRTGEVGTISRRTLRHELRVVSVALR